MKLVGARRGGRLGSGMRAGVVALSLLASVLHAGSASAEEPDVKHKVAVGFSNLVARVDNDEIGFAKPEYRVHILEALRDGGFNAVGAENLVFEKDESARADMVLGGIVKELTCRQVTRRLRCSVGIEWQLLDRERDEVVYRVLTRYAGFDLSPDNAPAAGKALTMGALRRLMGRPRFIKLLSAESSAPVDDDYTPASFQACAETEHQLPADFDRIADGTVVIKSGDGTGSGFTLTADGLLLTAAHVVASGKVEVRGHDGKLFPGRVVRISRKHDVALVSLGALDAPRACLPLQTSPQTPGTDVYAIGSPGGVELGFSLSRGIVSGLRTIGDVPLIQTDASLSPGNSGGPLVDGKGHVVGVVSRKIAGHAVEGLGFAIPVQAGLDALKLVSAAETTPSLKQPPPSAAPEKSKAPVNDSPDPRVSLDPEGDRQRAATADYERRVRERDERTPAYVPALRWGGLTVGIVGSLAVMATGIQKSNITRKEYEDQRLKNDLAWAATIVGWGAFTTSFIVAPKLAPASTAAQRRWSVAAGPTSVELGMSFE